MYLPNAFKEERVSVLHDAIHRAGLATLVSLTGEGLIASHVPLLIDPEPAPYGTLLGHLARANPQARGAIGDALAIFLGPDGYITPSWYATKRATGKVVPTWNYVADRLRREWAPVSNAELLPGPYDAIARTR